MRVMVEIYMYGRIMNWCMIQLWKVIDQVAEIFLIILLILFCSKNLLYQINRAGSDNIKKYNDISVTYNNIFLLNRKL